VCTQLSILYYINYCSTTLELKLQHLIQKVNAYFRFKYHLVLFENDAEF